MSEDGRGMLTRLRKETARLRSAGLPEAELAQVEGDLGTVIADAQVLVNVRVKLLGELDALHVRRVQLQAATKVLAAAVKTLAARRSTFLRHRGTAVLALRAAAAKEKRATANIEAVKSALGDVQMHIDDFSPFSELPWR